MSSATICCDTSNIEAFTNADVITPYSIPQEQNNVHFSLFQCLAENSSDLLLSFTKCWNVGQIRILIHSGLCRRELILRDLPSNNMC